MKGVLCAPEWRSHRDDQTFTTEVMVAWSDVYGLLAGTMKDAAREAA
jgi:hemoglobin-like flavoprotein